MASVSRCASYSSWRVSKILNFQSVAFVQGKWDGRDNENSIFLFFFFFFTRLTHFFHEKNKIWDSRLKRDRDSSGTIIEIPVSWRKISPGREQTGCFLFQGPIYFLSYISRQPHKIFRALVVLWWNGFYIIAIIPRCVDNTGLDPIEILEAIFSWSSSFFPSLFPFLLKYTYPFPFLNIDAFDAFH